MICRWQFSSEGYDIGFGVYRRTSEERQKASQMEEVMKTQRVNSHLVPEDGSITCTDVGHCKSLGQIKKICFDHYIIQDSILFWCVQKNCNHVLYIHVYINTCTYTCRQRHSFHTHLQIFLFLWLLFDIKCKLMTCFVTCLLCMLQISFDLITRTVGQEQRRYTTW